MSVDEVEAAGRERNPMWHDAEWGPWARSKKQYHPPPNFKASFPVADSWRAAIKVMDVPALLIYGGNSERGAIVTDEVAAEVRALNPRVETTQLATAGHNIRRETYDDFMAAVREFLARNP